jgi:hypothetical protein
MESQKSIQLKLGMIVADFVSACLDSMAEQQGGLSSAAIEKARKKHVALWIAASRAELPSASSSYDTDGDDDDDDDDDDDAAAADADDDDDDTGVAAATANHDDDTMDVLIGDISLFEESDKCVQ